MARQLSPQEIRQSALLAAMDPDRRGAAEGFVDQVGRGLPDFLSMFKKFNAPSGAAVGIGIGGEILGRLLKPKHDAPNMTSPFASYLNSYKRREEGSGDGVLGGASKWGGRGASLGSVIPGVGTAIGAGTGAVAGALGNLFTKNARSAYTDFNVADAKQAIRDIYLREGGRAADEAEVDRIVAGQGLKPGGKWVGEKGMMSVLDNLRSNFRKEAQQDPNAEAARAQRALLAQMGGGA